MLLQVAAAIQAHFIGPGRRASSAPIERHILSVSAIEVAGALTPPITDDGTRYTAKIVHEVALVLAVIRAVISVVGVAVIAGFFTAVQYAVAASGDLTSIGAGISRLEVTVIASLDADVNIAIAASSLAAVVQAGVVVAVVAVITGLHAGVDEAITAAVVSAVIETGV